MSIKFEQGEERIFEIRKHWFILMVEIGSSILFAFAPLVLIGIGNLLPIEIVFQGNPTLTVLSLYLMWLLGVWVVLFIMWTDYYLDVWVITDKRLIDIEQQGLFNRRISALELTKIQDVTSSVEGLLPTLLNFGDVHVQTAGSEKEFVIRNVAKPNVTRQKIEESLKEARQKVQVK